MRRTRIFLNKFYFIHVLLVRSSHGDLNSVPAEDSVASVPPLVAYLSPLVAHLLSPLYLPRAGLGAARGGCTVDP